MVLALGMCFASVNAHAANAKKKAAAAARKPASAGKGFKVKISGDFTRVIDEEQGIVCYFAKQGGGSCVNLPR